MMKQKTIILLVVIMISHMAHGQLGRRAFLGVRIVNVNDSLARISQMDKPEGVYVQELVPGGTGENIGLAAGDVILTVNNTRISSSNDLVVLAGSMQGGDNVAVEVMRKGRKLTFSGTMKPMPLQTSAFGEVVYGAVAFDKGYVRTIIYKPDGTGKFPAVFFIQGYTCHSVENPGNAYRQIINGLLQKGYAVVMTEKASVGDSRNDQPCSDCDLWKEVDLFSASYNALPEHDFIDLDNVYIFGHSMGGVQAPLLQTDFPPKAIAVYGTVARPWFEYFIEQARIQNLLMGDDYIENEKNYESSLRFYYEFMINRQTPEELSENEEFRQFLLSSWNYDGDGHMNGRHYTFWQQLQDTRLFTAWSKTPAQVYSIWGEGDFVAFNPYEHQLIADIVNHYNPGKARFISLPNIDHSFTRVNNRRHAVEVFQDYEYQQKNFNPAIVELLHECFQE